MINAITARENVNKYRQNVYFEVAKLVRETLEEIGKSIEFHSQNGHVEAEFSPYDKSRYHYNRDMLESAEIEFDTILKQNQYQVEENSWKKNILKIRW